MLEKCNENCIETEGGLGFIPCTETIETDCVILGEDMNLCSIDVKSTDSLKKIISAFDKVLCSIKDKTIEIVYDDIDVTDSCIIKTLITDAITGKKSIKLGLDKSCLCNTVNDCKPIVVSPFLITSSKYSICGTQTAVLTSTKNNTIWYNQAGAVIGNGFTKTVTTGGLYYASSDGKVSNIINIVYQAICDTYSYTKVKNFYKTCPDGFSSTEYTYSKVYLSEISYQDATIKADLDSSIFNEQGQAIVDTTGNCNGNPPTNPSCFNLYLTNATCGNTPSPVPSSSPAPTIIPTPSSSGCNLSVVITNVRCASLPSCLNGSDFSITGMVNIAGTTTYNVNFNSANLTNAQVVIKNNTGAIVREFPQLINNRPMSIDLGVLDSGDYRLQFIGLSCEGTSNTFLFTVSTLSPDGGNPVPTQVPTQIVNFSNVLKALPVETQTDKFSVLPFANVTIPLKAYDNTRQFPKYPVVWHSKLDNFISANKRVWDVGISFPVDIIPNRENQSGDGVLCVDYIRYANPNTGEAWVNGIDPVCNISTNNFVSARPFQRRVKGEGGTAITNDDTYEQLYDSGFQYTRSDQFGYGDNVGNKTNTGFSVTDVENGEHGRFEEIPILIGMANNTFGHVTSMYNQAINIAFPNLSHYPLNYSTGGYRTTQVEIDGSPKLDGNTGQPEINEVINDAWKPENKVTISSRGINNKGLIDFENAKESGEVSCYSSAAYFQGDTINYDGTNTRIINKFGVNRNTEHIVAHTIYATQVRKWYLRKYFNDREFYTLAKTLCDRGNIGLTTFNTGSTFVTNPELLAKHLPRKLAFIKTMFVPFEGSYFHHWDRNTVDKNIDGINGDLFAINLINQKKTLSQGNLSFVDLFDDFDFKLWTAEISYDGGNTWKQEKGTDYIMSPNSIPHAQCITSNGVWAVFLARPENTENLTCKLRILYNGSYRYLDVTANMWETTNYTYKDSSLANIPNVAKDYYYNLIDLNNTPVATPITTPVVSGNTVNVFIMAGESNSGTRNPSSTLLAGEGGIRAGVRIWNNNTNVLEPLNIGINNALDENDVIEYGWGWENQLANLRRDGVLNSDIIIVKTGQGGAFIQSYHPTRTAPNPNYYNRTLTKINGVKAALATEGKTPVFYIMYSQGINDALADGGNGTDPENFPGLSGSTYWKAATLAHLQRLRDVTGQNTKICLMKFWDFPQITLGGYTNTKIDEIVALSPNNLFINCSDLTGQLYSDQVHLNQTGTKIATDRYITAFGFGSLAPDSVPAPITPIPSPVPVSSNVVIVEPNRPQYYFSDMKAPSYYSDVTHGPLPAMYAANPPLYNSERTIPSGTLLSSYITMNRQYDPVDDIVYLKNNQVEFGINLKRGGQVAIARKAGETFNYIYNGFDGGFQVTVDAYQKVYQDNNPNNPEVPYVQQGEIGGSGNANMVKDYNAIQGGDYNNNSVSLLDYYPITNGYYVKVRPIFYNLTGKLSETYMEAWYTLEGRVLKCQYKYTSFRTDSQITNGFHIVGWSIPSCFLQNSLTRYKVYTGDSPYTNAPVTDGLIPTSGVCANPVRFTSKEFWGMAYNPNTGNGFGVFNASEGGNSVDFEFKQCEVNPGVTGTEFAGGFTFMNASITLTNITGGTFVKNSTAYITVGNESEIRSSFNALNQL